jgi:hypothetical protein
MILPAICMAVIAVSLVDLWRSHVRFSRNLARLDALAAGYAEAPCPALSHVRLVPRDAELPEAESRPEDDLFVRMVAALNVFAAENGYEVPVPLLWTAIASVTAEAILGEDLAKLVAGPGLPEGGER